LHLYPPKVNLALRARFRRTSELALLIPGTQSGTECDAQIHLTWVFLGSRSRPRPAKSSLDADCRGPKSANSWLWDLVVPRWIIGGRQVTKPRR
jgi:hypothetical protein